MKLFAHVMSLVFFWGVLLGLIYRSVRKSDSPQRLLVKWGVTAAVIVGFIKEVLPLIIGPFPSIFTSTSNASAPSQSTVIIGMLLTAFCSTIIGVMWATNWTDIIISPFLSIFDGGDEEIEAQAFYSKAKMLRGKGQIREAIAEIRTQLEEFPDDFAGQMLLAEIAVENHGDLPGADAMIQRIVNTKGRAPGQIAGALNTLADWHLKFGQDPDSARLALGRIAELLPDSPFSQAASQRIAHLASANQLASAHERPTIVMKPFQKNIGAQRHAATDVKAPVDDPEQRAAAYIQHLQEHPLDTDARENLATLYAEHYQRLDLAENELEQLIIQPNHPPKQIVHWLNLLADFQIKVGNNLTAAEKAIRRIMESFPDTAYATQANTRLQYLRLESRRSEKSQAVKLGSYQKDLGLKKVTG